MIFWHACVLRPAVPYQNALKLKKYCKLCGYLLLHYVCNQLNFFQMFTLSASPMPLWNNCSIKMFEILLKVLSLTFERNQCVNSLNCTVLGFHSIVCPLTQFNPPFRSSGQSTASKLLARSPPAAQWARNRKIVLYMMIIEIRGIGEFTK